MSINSVRQLHSRFLRGGETVLVGRTGRGGRRHGSLEPQQERDLLARYEESAVRGGVLTVGQIMEDCGKLAGHPVSAASVYRMMGRIGWRKVVPRPHHPRKQPDSEEAFKKSSRKSSRRSVGGAARGR
jgi:transposase